jgi:thiol-disulfide isomerase/thioredoxin
MKKVMIFSAAVLCMAVLSSSFSKSTEKSKTVPRVGQKATDLSYLNPDGESMALSDLEGHVVLLDFWASWCGPCRRKNPSIVAVYEKYRDKKFIKGTEGFEVYSLSLDKNKDRWLAAIEKDKLDWDYHVSDLKGWSSEGARKYGVRSIPSTFLIDEEGYILLVNPSSAAIELELDKRLKGKK